MVTIQDVAKHAGVSVATVSHVLNKTRYVSPKLEEKVELSIRELGYEPIRKNAGRILKNQIVGVIIPDLSVDFYAVFANEITYLLEKHEFKVVLLDSCGDSGRETENLMSLNWQSNVIAVIVIPLSKILPWNGTKLKKKCLIVGEIPEKQKFHIVLPEYENASFKAVQQLILSGHESIALLLQDKTDRTSSAEYYSGYKSAHRHYRINPKENSIYYETDLKTEKVKDLFYRYTAVICATDRITMRLFQELERAEMTCPEDMSVISLEWNQRSGVYQPALTVIGVDGETIKGVVIENKAGCQAILADVIIDATGDGDVAYLAGASYKMGRDEDGKTQPLTTMFRIGGMPEVGKEQIEKFSKYPKGKVQPYFLFWEAPEFIYGHVCIFGTPRKGEYRCEMTRSVDKNGLNPDDLTKAEIECRRQIPKIVEYFRKEYPGAENVYLIDSAGTVGVQDSRRIVGEYEMTMDDLLECREFEDVIALGCYPIDLHNPMGRGYDMRFIKYPGQAYGIPYRCIVPAKIENLLVAGRCISADFYAESAIRISSTCMAIGEAAGTAAALCVVKHKSPRDLDANLLRQKLASQGVCLEQFVYNTPLVDEK